MSYSRLHSSYFIQYRQWRLALVLFCVICIGMLIGVQNVLAQDQNSAQDQNDASSAVFLPLLANSSKAGATPELIHTSALVTIIDDAVDDVGGSSQRDLNALTVDTANLPTSMLVGWNWDNSGFSGGNSGDACSLYDTDNPRNGLADYALCVVVNGDPGTYQSTRLYSCNDGSSTSCTGPTLIADTDAGTAAPLPASTCSASVVATSDPFRTIATHTSSRCAIDNSCTQDDTVAACTVQMSDFGNVDAFLLNVCANSSSEPNSNTVDCVVNPTNGFLTIKKIDTVPGDQTTFNFTSNRAISPTNFTITGTGQVSLLTFPSGSSTRITEVVPSGWQLSAANCHRSNGTTTGTLSGSTVANIQIETALETTCTFTNSLQTSALTITKVVSGVVESDLAGWNFSATGSTNTTFSTPAAGGTQSKAVNVGTYTITETADARYSTVYACSNGSSGASNIANNITIPATGVSCTFTNTRRSGQLGITKVVVGGVEGDISGWNFTATGPTATTFSTGATGGTQNKTVNTGAYIITETVDARYTTTYACSDGSSGTSNVANITVPTTGASCTFTNTRQTGLLTVTKVVSGGVLSGVTGWNFTVAGPVQTLLSTPAGGGTSSQTVNTGAYVISEATDARYNTEYACSDGSAGASNVANLTVPTTGASCTFTNTVKRGQISVKKVTIPSGLTQEFTFTASYQPNFTLSDGATNTSAALSPGNYTLDEIQIPLGWSQTGASCSDGSIPPNLTLDPNEMLSCTFTNTVQSSAIDIIKTASASLIDPGVSVTYLYTVTTSGQSPLNPVVITDDKCSPLSGPTKTLDDGDNYLEAGEEWLYSCTMSLTADTLNTAIVTGTTPLGAEVSASDTAIVDVRPTITATKTATPSSVPESGGVVLFTFIITNTSSEVVTTTALNDSVFGNLAGQNTCAINQPIQPGASYTCSVSKQIAGDFGTTHDNTLTATAMDNEGNPATATASASVTFSDVLPGVTLSKVADPLVRAEPGGLFTYTLTIVNTSTETVTIQSLTDDSYPLPTACSNLVGQDLSPTGAAGDSATCSYSTMLSVPGTYTNTASIDVADNEENLASDSDQAVVTVTDVPSSIQVDKIADPTSLIEPGGTVTFTVLITNTSATDVMTVTTLVDDTNNDGSNDTTYDPALICDQTVLAPAAAATCTFQRTLAGNFGDLLTDVVTVSTIDDDQGLVVGQDSATVAILNAISGLALSKIAEPTSLPEPGGLVTFTLRMTNTSVADVITLTQLSDSHFLDVTIAGHDGIQSTTCAVPQVLDFGAVPSSVYECYFVATVTGNAGYQHQNVAVALGQDNDGLDVGALDDALVTITDLQSSMIVTKTADPISVPETGGTVTYTVLVHNLSTVDTMTVTHVVDNRFGDIGNTCTPAVSDVLPALLLPGDMITCSFTRLLPPGNFGTVHNNEVTAIATDDDQQALAGKANATVTYSDTPAVLEVIKTPDRLSVPEIGGVVTYSVVVRNISVADTISVTTINDDKFGDISADCTPVVSANPPVVLVPGQSFSCTFIGTLPLGNVGTSHINTVTVGGIDDDGGDPVVGQGSASVAYSDTPSAMSVLKTANVNSVSATGTLVTFTVRIENSSAADSITINSIQDSVYGNVAVGNNPNLVSSTCTTGQTLAPAQVYSCQFSAMISGRVGDRHSNIISVNAIDSDNQPLSGTDNEIVDIADPIIVATKSDALIEDANQNGVANPGDVVGYTIVIRNIGNVAATGLVFNDLLDSNVALINGSVIVNPVQSIELGNSPGDTNVRINLGTLAAQAVVNIRFNVRIDTPLPGGVIHIANQGQVSGGNIPSTPTDDPQTPIPDDPTVTPVIAAPLISSSKNDALVVDADNNGIVSPGDTLEYRIFVVNNGNVAATGVVFNDTPDVNTSLVVSSVQTSQGTVTKGNTAGDTSVQVTIGTLAGNGGNVAISFRVLVNKPLRTGTTLLRNQGVVYVSNIPSTPTDDPETIAPGDSTDTPAVASPIIDATKRATLLVDADNNNVASPGDTLSYQIVIVNNGNAAATGLFYDDTPDPNTTLIVGSVKTSQGTILKGNTAGNTNIRVEIGTLAANGGQVTLSYEVRINNPLPTSVKSVRNQGIATSQEVPPVTTDDPRTPDVDDPTITPIDAAPVLDVDKVSQLLIDADKDGVVSAGDTLNYTVDIVNRGNAAANNVIFSDTVDVNTKLVNGSVQTNNQATILSGNGAGEQHVQVSIPVIPGNGGSAKISFRVTINSPLPSGVTQVANQGTVKSTELPDILSDDPNKPGLSDPTINPVASAPNLVVNKQDLLFTDANGDGKVTVGDTLLYRVTIVNNGTTSAVDVVFRDTPDTQTELVNGTVQSSMGTVVEGNAAGQKNVVVNIGEIPGNATVTIGFQVKIISNTRNTISNQATVAYSAPTSTRDPLPTAVSNDPDTAEPADPTRTLIEEPQALDPTEEPAAAKLNYLPLVVR